MLRVISRVMVLVADLVAFWTAFFAVEVVLFFFVLDHHKAECNHQGESVEPKPILLNQEGVRPASVYQNLPSCFRHEVSLWRPFLLC